MMTKIGLLAIRLYRTAISPYHPPVCRHTPSCSRYAEQALEKHGFFKGGRMALWRLLRCNPFVPGGHDPVR